MISIRVIAATAAGLANQFRVYRRLDPAIPSRLLSCMSDQHAILLIGTCLALGSAISAYSWPLLWEWPYRAWNKLARHYGQFSRLYLLGLCYMIISSVRLAGPCIRFFPEIRSRLWLDCQTPKGASH